MNFDNYRLLQNDFLLLPKSNVLPQVRAVVNTGAHYDSRRQRYRYTGSGIGSNQQEAAGKALFELMERYHSSIRNFPAKRLLRASAAELQQKKIPFVPPEKLRFFAPGRYPDGMKPLGAEDKIFWLKAHQYHKGLPWVLLPAFLCFWDFPKNDYYIPSSTGFACGNTLEQAIRYSYYELVERHLFSVLWYSQDDHTLVKHRGRDIVQGVARENSLFNDLEDNRCSEIIFIDMVASTGLTGFSGFGYLCLCYFERDGATFFSTGASYNHSQVNALGKSLSEAFKNIPYFVSNHEHGGYKHFSAIRAVGDIPRLTSFDEHFFFWNYAGALRGQTSFFRDAENGLYNDIVWAPATEAIVAGVPEQLYYTILKTPGSVFPYFIVRSWDESLTPLSPDSHCPFNAFGQLLEQAGSKISLPHFFP